MAIKKYYVSSEKPGYQYDAKSKKYFSWGIDICAGGKRYQTRGFPTKTEAENAVLDFKQRARSDKFGFATSSKIPYLIELFQKKLDSMEQGNDRVRAKRVFKYFLALLPPRIKVTDLRTAHLRLFVEARQKDTDARTGSLITPQTIRRELVPIVASLRSAFEFFDSLDDYHAPRIPRPKIPKGQKERVISPAEQDALFAYFFTDRRADEDRRSSANRQRTGQFLLFCLLTLSRPGEIAALKKTDVDLAAGTVSIHGTKTRFHTAQSTRRLVITSTMAKILRERLEASAGEFLFTRSGRVTPAMYEHMKTACEAIGSKYGGKDKDAISFHTARHTGITMLLQSGVDLKTVGRIAGHSDERMTMYYSHSSAELVNRASEILEGKMGREIAVYLGI